MVDPRFAGRDIPDPGFASDDGGQDPRLGALLAAMADGSGEAGQLLRALVDARLLVPVVAVLEEVETGPDGLRHEKTSSMASVTVEAPDGSRSLLAFTSTDSLQAWRADARPIAVPGRRAAQAALAEGADHLVIDPSGPAPVAVGGAELRALALAEDPTVEVHRDALVVDAVTTVVAGEPAVATARIGASPPQGIVVELSVDELRAEAFDALVARLQSALAADPLLRARLGGLRLTFAPEPGDEEDVAYRRA